ncbi:MAG TPA: hydantoinase B/oxoprolinase family protein, partial [Alphaproteobacteria bacterium]|nr:hydantoinase B/oxoprolinase family protein [Alphaproteobacteria bacterium]
LGMGLADATAHREQGIEAPLGESLPPQLEQIFEQLTTGALAELEKGGANTGDAETRRTVHIRYQGSDTTLIVPFGSVADMTRNFEAAHKARFGFTDEGKQLTIEAVSLEAIAREGAGASSSVRNEPRESPAPPLAETRFFSQVGWHDAPVIDRAALVPGDTIRGPAIIVEGHGTNVVEPGWRADFTSEGNLLVTRATARPRRMAIGTQADPIRLEIFNNLFMSIAEEMGVVLRNTAHSVNMKERLDFSCAVFDGAGELIANAPHVPVHLGSMSESVRTIIREDGETMRPGDVFALNAPYNGGTHLPDVTVITPVFGDDGHVPLFYVASRGHHGDIGGLTPGSVPPSSTSVEEEGILIDNFLLVSAGKFREAETRALLASGRYPARKPDQNIADLKAQIAANEKGAADLKRMVAQFGLDVVNAYMGHVRDNAEESVRRVIGVLKDGAFEAPLDIGATIKVAITIDREARGATIDFTGTSPASRTNFNAPHAVCMAAVLYVFRCLVDDDIPLNGGCLKPLKIVVPEGCLLNPQYPAAVVAGNVETSQVIVDALFGALGVLAGSQGTMNNLTFGNAHHQYYETICGGTGAGADYDGASAVQSHMTNSRLTDPEVLELRYPVVVDDFAIRAGSGGDGRHRGGDGAIRRIRFLEPMTAAILSNRRTTDPFGLEGGRSGRRGVNRVERADGACELLASSAQTTVEVGDAIVIETPGGGGFGRT